MFCKSLAYFWIDRTRRDEPVPFWPVMDITDYQDTNRVLNSEIKKQYYGETQIISFAFTLPHGQCKDRLHGFTEDDVGFSGTFTLD